MRLFSCHETEKKLFLLLVFSIYLKVHNISNIIMLIIDSITNLVKDVSRLFKNDFSKNIRKKTVFSHKPENFQCLFYIFNSIPETKKKKIIVCITGIYCAIYFF